MRSDRKTEGLRALRNSLRVPVIAAPMFLVSGPDWVTACCRAGVIGTLPAHNARTAAQLDTWLSSIESSVGEGSIGEGAAPYAVNLVVHASNTRLAEDTQVVVGHKVPIVVASVGNPAALAETVHAYGGLLLADVATLRHVRKAVQAGVDGLILLCAGAGGHGGWLNPFAFVSAVREFYDGPIVLAGCIGSGRELRAAEILGADFGYVGTHLIATTESLASPDYIGMMIESDGDDVVFAPASNGLPANFLRPSLERAGIDPNAPSAASDAKMWKDVWSAGHGVHATKSRRSVAEVIEQLAQQYAEARQLADGPA